MEQIKPQKNKHVKNSSKKSKARPKWYHSGLAFECVQCGNCCSGPEEGYIWITAHEIKLAAEFLGITIKQFRRQFTRRVGFRISLLEEPATKDCIFLKNISGKRGCMIYPVRPNQCRTWPFWNSNLHSPDIWNSIAQKCPGINRGKLFTFEQIESLRKQKKWWNDE